MGKVSGGTKINLTITVLYDMPQFLVKVCPISPYDNTLREFAAVNKYFAPNLTKVLLITNERTKSCQ